MLYYKATTQQWARLSIYLTAGPPHLFSCQCQCPDMHRSGLSDQCTLMWETPPTVRCSSLQQFNVLLTQPDGTLVYKGSFGQSVSSTETIPLNPNTVYTATITALNVCGNTACSANCSPVLIEGKNQLVC